MLKNNTDKPLGIAAILVLALLSAVAPLATDMYLSGFPKMAEDLNASAASIQMTLTSFLIGLAAGQLIIGPLSDRYGRRNLLLFGTLLAIVSGFLCAFTPNVSILIGLRLLQGIGGAAGVVLSRAIISDKTDDAIASARLFQIMMVIGGLAPILAPTIGTFIVEFINWRAVFIFFSILSLLSFIGTLRYIGESLQPEKRSAGGISTLLRGIGYVISNKIFLGYTLTVGLAFMTMFAYISASPFVFQGILGLTPFEYSAAFGINALGIAIISAISAKIVNKYSPAKLASLGLILMTIGTIATLLSFTLHLGTIMILASIFVTISSLGLTLGNASALAIRVTPNNAGTASALIGALQFLFGAIASPLVGIAGKDDPYPMAILMVITAIGAALCFIFASRAAAVKSA